MGWLGSLWNGATQALGSVGQTLGNSLGSIQQGVSHALHAGSDVANSIGSTISDNADTLGAIDPRLGGAARYLGGGLQSGANLGHAVGNLVGSDSLDSAIKNGAKAYNAGLNFVGDVSNVVYMIRVPRVFTFIIQSAKRISGTAADYYVNLPQISALTNGADRPDEYEMYLDRIVGSYLIAGGNPDTAVTNDFTGYVQLALDIPAPYLTASSKVPNVKFIIPVQSLANGYAMDNTTRTMNPIIVSASGIASMLHVQLYNDVDTLMAPGLHEHIIVLTIKERFR